MAQLGDMLRSAREAKGVSLAQAEAATMIKRSYLQALEDDDHGTLPGAVYTKGFLRNYAVYLGLDASHVLSLYHREYPDLSQDIVAPSRIKPHGTSQLITGGTLAAAVLVVVIAFFSVYVYRAGAGLPPGITGGQPGRRRADADVYPADRDGPGRGQRVHSVHGHGGAAAHGHAGPECRAADRQSEPGCLDAGADRRPDGIRGRG